jgi:hypothetical protein
MRPRPSGTTLRFGAVAKLLSHGPPPGPASRPWARGSPGWLGPVSDVEGIGRETSPFDGENCLRSALRGFLGGRFNFVDKPDFPSAYLLDLAVFFQSTDACIEIGSFMPFERLRETWNLAQFH